MSKIEIRKVENGFMISVHTQDYSAYVGSIGVSPTTRTKEYVADSMDSAIEKLKELLK